MKLPISWLKEYLPKLPAPHALADLLMMHGLEVEEIIDHSGDFKNVVVGEIVGIKAHPNADKLRLADVIITASGQPQEIVCGAPNIEVGQKVPVALLGAILPNGMSIEPRAIRGVTSNGMLCAEDELGLGKNHAGIMVLDAGLKVGTPFAEATGLDDVVFDIAISANRSDLFSVRGLAREIGAILGSKPKITNNKKQIMSKPQLPRADEEIFVKVDVKDKKLCPVYTTRVIRGVKIQPSPLWIQHRLRAAGMRTINAVVDATNYIMLDYGQPLHAFDAKTVEDESIIVRPAKDGEHLMTLDKQNRKLDSSMLVIADAQGPIALAGVMGGADTEITDTTSDIILESAIFDPVSIRKTSWKLGLQSEASRRFEKGLPLTLPEEASVAAATLIVALCGGTVEKGSVTVGAVKTKAATITIKPTFISELLGMSIPSAKAKAILTRLGFKVTGTTSWKLQIPPWRLDVTTPEDIVDEVGRMMGYDELPAAPLKDNGHQSEIPEMIRFKEVVRNALYELGFSEIISHAFYSLKEAFHPSSDSHFVIANPIDKTQAVLRSSLQPQIMNVLEREADAGHDVKVFEIGRIFNPSLSGQTVHQQPWKLAIGSTSKDVNMLISSIVKELKNKLNATVDLKVDFFGRIKENSQQHEDKMIRGRWLRSAEIDLAELLFISRPDYYRKVILPEIQSYKHRSKYQEVIRDISFWSTAGMVEKDWSEVFNAGGKPLIFGVQKTDEFQKDNKQSLTFRLTFQSPDRTLTKAEVDAIMDRLMKTITSLGATIR